MKLLDVGKISGGAVRRMKTHIEFLVWAKIVPPGLNCSIAQIDPPFVGQCSYTSDQIYSTKTELFRGWSECLVRAKDLQHHSQADDLRARFKVPEWRVFCHTTRLRSSPPCLKLILSDSARQISLPKITTCIVFFFATLLVPMILASMFTILNSPDANQSQKRFL